jgi:hypothetical protein
MAIEMNNTDRTIGAVDAAEERESDGVVATQGNQPWKRLALLRPPFDACIGLGLTGEERIMAFFNLLKSIGIVITITMVRSDLMKAKAS